MRLGKRFAAGGCAAAAAGRARCTDALACGPWRGERGASPGTQALRKLFVIYKRYLRAEGGGRGETLVGVSWTASCANGAPSQSNRQSPVYSIILQASVVQAARAFILASACVNTCQCAIIVYPRRAPSSAACRCMTASSNLMRIVVAVGLPPAASTVCADTLGGSSRGKFDQDRSVWGGVGGRATGCTGSIC